MTKRSTLILILDSFIYLVVLSNRGQAKEYMIGGGMGWTMPPGCGTYASWASNITFVVGDIQGSIFGWCSALYTDCNFQLSNKNGNNCLQGMKLAINATAPEKHHEHGRGCPSPTRSPSSAPSPGVTSAGAAGSLVSLLPALNGGREEPQGKSSAASFTATFYPIFSSVAAFFFCQI